MSSQEPVPIPRNGEASDGTAANGADENPPRNSEETTTAQQDKREDETPQCQKTPITLEEKQTPELDDHESVPDDLEDFIVLDEAECTESEDEVPSHEDKEDEDEDSMQWDCPLERLAPRTYTDKQLQPTQLDPRCKPDWPLAGYWPVYVGNFRLFKKFDSDYNCSHAVHKYFASKGLPAFMVYRLKDAFFNEYQKRVGFYDMLVYFCNKKDAIRAVRWCHRDLYYGHRLNVYCGRIPAVFPKARSYRFKHKKAEDKLETESNLEDYLSSYGKIMCISKHDLDSVLVQFPRARWPLIFPKDPRVQPFKINKVVNKQRFVESDIEVQLAKEIADNPRFMRMRLVFKLLLSIKHGVIPEMQRPWENAEVDEALIEQRRQNNRRLINSYNLNNKGTLKRKHEDFDSGPSAKSRRQLIKEAKSLETQLMRIKTKINERKPASKPFNPKIIVKSKNPDLVSVPPGEKTKRQLARQRNREARRNQNKFRMLPNGTTEMNKDK